MPNDARISWLLLRLARSLQALAEYERGSWVDPEPFLREARAVWAELGWRRLTIEQVVSRIKEDPAFLDKVLDEIAKDFEEAT